MCTIVSYITARYPVYSITGQLWYWVEDWKSEVRSSDCCLEFLKARLFSDAQFHGKSDISPINPQDISNLNWRYTQYLYCIYRIQFPNIFFFFFIRNSNLDNCVCICIYIWMYLVRWSRRNISTYICNMKYFAVCEHIHVLCDYQGFLYIIIDGTRDYVCVIMLHMYIIIPGNLIARSRQNTARSRHKPPVLGLILPFTTQSHSPFSVFLTGPPQVLLATRYNCSRGYQS